MAAMDAGAFLSTHGDPGDAVEELLSRGAAWTADHGAPDLACVFSTHHHASAFAELARGIDDRISPAGGWIGCTAEGVIGEGREIEGSPGLVLWLARWGGGVEVSTFHLTADEKGALSGWPDPLPGRDTRPAVLLLGDPFSTPAESLLDHLNNELPGCPVFGGIASGASFQGASTLFGDGRLLDAGVVGALLTGTEVPLEATCVVSQGCQPIGRTLSVTAHKENLIQTLDSRPALEVLQKMLSDLPPEQQDAARSGLHVGLGVDDWKEDLARGDFLIRGIIGIEPQTGAVAVNERVRADQRLQFHIRDAASSTDDLRTLLAAHTSGTAAGLLFACNGRGQRLYGRPDGDVSVVTEALGEAPVAGFHAAGEIGPVGGQAFLHGFTASLALFGDG